MSEHDEFKRIMDFFKLSPAERADNFEEIFSSSADFFEKLNYILKNGSLEEKQKIIEELQTLQETVQQETEKLKETVDMSDEELKAFAENPDNFSPEHWELIQESRKRIQGDAKQAADMLNFTPEDENAPKKKKGKKGKGGKSDWVKS